MVGFESSETDDAIREAGVVLVPPGDIQSLAGAVTRILCDNSFREHLRMRNRVASRKSFSWDAISDQLLRALRGGEIALFECSVKKSQTKYRALFVCTHPVQKAVRMFRRMEHDHRLDILVANSSLQGAETYAESFLRTLENEQR